METWHETRFDRTDPRDQHKRAQGQLAAVTCMLEEGRDKDIVTQFATVSKTLDRDGFGIIATGLEQCIAREDTTMDKKDLEKPLLLSLA